MQTATQESHPADPIAALLSQLTLEEKVTMLAGASMWHTVAVARLGIPALKVSDGPNGARGGEFIGGVKAAAFPAGILLAATWNTALIERIGAALAAETKSKGAQVLLAPTVNIHRSPLGGRNFESFSEDPYLAARMTVAYINGLQGQGVGATVKHYLGNEQEFERYSISAEVDERTLREIYLPPFQAAVREAKTWALMASYNLVNGVAASESVYFLHDVLRDEWGWDGLAMSDWFMSVKSTTASVNAGLDLEMPGPGQWRGEKLQQAVKNGEVAESKLDESVYRLLRLLQKTGQLEQPAEQAEQAIDLPEHRALIRETAAEGIVLLKNADGALPLHADKLLSVAIIGPNAQEARIMGGGSAQVNAHYRVTPYDGVVSKLGKEVAVGFSQGCTIHKMLPLADSGQFFAGQTGTEPGFEVEYFNGTEPRGTVVHTMQVPSTELAWFGPLPEGVDPAQFAVRAGGRFTPPQDGTYLLSLTSAGRSYLYIDGQQVIDNWTDQQVGATYFGMGSSEIVYEAQLRGGHEYNISVDFSKNPALMLAAVRLGIMQQPDSDLIAQAAALAARSDVALVFAGLSSEWDSEGFDRADLELPGAQHTD